MNANNAILILISIPVWIAAVMSFFWGLFGVFHPNVKYEQAWLALYALVTSSGLFFFASRLCGLVT